MKIKFLSICVFLMLLSGLASAGTTTMTSWYPPPTAAYNQIKLTTGIVASGITPAFYCTSAGHIGSYFLNSLNNAVYQCTTATGGAVSFCSTNSNSMIADNTGTIHICNSTTDTIYPQQCYNSFCSYDSSTGATSCSPSCAPGYFEESIDSLGDCSDKFQTSVHTFITSILCCSTNTNACTCTPATCASLGDNCGTPPDGCGGTLSCGGSCPGSETCGGAGIPYQCGTGTCIPTCNGGGSDGCGGSCLSCGSGGQFVGYYSTSTSYQCCCETCVGTVYWITNQPCSLSACGQNC